MFVGTRIFCENAARLAGAAPFPITTSERLVA